MCGRFTLILEITELQREAHLEDIPPDWNPKYNISPSQDVLVITQKTLQKAEWMQWGLIPFWVKEVEKFNPLINSRSETINVKPSFRLSFSQRRCLILASGFFEWLKGKISQPYYFTLNSHSLFAFAGIWDTWHSPEGTARITCSIITCSANSLVGKIHPRMPVIITPENFANWLNPESQNKLFDLMSPFPEQEMDCYPVTTNVNNSRSEDKTFITPLK